jgi:AraC-like DNA-binding protein
VDAAAHTALTEMVRATVSRDLDELHARVDALEQRLAAPRSFHRAELERQRRAAVLAARAEGLSFAKIASVLGVSTRTVATIVNGERVAEPAEVLGVDGRLHAARHDWGPGRRSTPPPNGNRPAA